MAETKKTPEQDAYTDYLLDEDGEGLGQTTTELPKKKLKDTRRLRVEDMQRIAADDTPPEE